MTECNKGLRIIGWPGILCWSGSIECIPRPRIFNDYSFRPSLGVGFIGSASDCAGLDHGIRLGEGAGIAPSGVVSAADCGPPGGQQVSSAEDVSAGSVTKCEQACGSDPTVTASATVSALEGKALHHPSQDMTSSRLADSLRKDYDYIVKIANDYLSGDNPPDADIVFALFDAASQSREAWQWSEPMLT